MSSSKSNKKEEKNLDKNENIINKTMKTLTTPFDKLLYLSNEIGFDVLIDYIVNIILSNKSKQENKISFCDNKDIEKNLKDILKKISEEELFINLMKILTDIQKENIEKESEFKLSLDSKLRSRASINLIKKKIYFKENQLED